MGQTCKDYFAFYPGRVACYIDGERVEPQPGRFYGGWITSDVVGPFKGEPGTGHWQSSVIRMELLQIETDSQ